MGVGWELFSIYSLCVLLLSCPSLPLQRMLWPPPLPLWHCGVTEQESEIDVGRWIKEDRQGDTQQTTAKRSCSAKVGLLVCVHVCVHVCLAVFMCCIARCIDATDCVGRSPAGACRRVPLPEHSFWTNVAEYFEGQPVDTCAAVLLRVVS